MPQKEPKTKVLPKIYEAHLIPRCDIIEHIESDECPCDPCPTNENLVAIERGLTDKMLWVHQKLKDIIQ